MTPDEIAAAKVAVRGVLSGEIVPDAHSALVLARNCEVLIAALEEAQRNSREYAALSTSDREAAVYLRDALLKWAREAIASTTLGQGWLSPEQAKAWAEKVKEKCADLHPNIDPASDAERLRGAPGAGAMGAVIDYRDAIRALDVDTVKP